jgi:hypothetical protein
VPWNATDDDLPWGRGSGCAGNATAAPSVNGRGLVVFKKPPVAEEGIFAGIQWLYITARSGLQLELVELPA